MGITLVHRSVQAKSVHLEALFSDSRCHILTEENGRGGTQNQSKQIKFAALGDLLII